MFVNSRKLLRHLRPIVILVLLTSCFSRSDSNDPLADAKGAYERGDFVLARQLLEPLAVGNGLAQYSLGLIYEQGLGVPQSEETAALLYERAAARGIVGASYRLGQIYFSTTHESGQVANDYVKALRWFREAADRGYVEANLMVAQVYLQGSNFVEAARWTRRAAEAGNADGQFRLGDFYREGSGVEQSYEEAVRWYKSGAEQGQIAAQFHLAWAYELGRGINRDDRAAFDWYYKVANGKQSSIRDLARKIVGDCYRNGRGVTQSDIEAFYWFSKAANGEIPDAQFALGEFYEAGRGTGPSAIEAVVWYTLAAKGYARFGDAKEALIQVKLDRLGGSMSPEDLKEAKRRADNWRPSETRTARGGGSTGLITSIFDAH